MQPVRSCKDCDCDLPSNRYTICKQCSELEQLYSRKCRKCKKQTISPAEDDLVDKCTGCRSDTDNRTRDGMRQCSSCKEMTIYPRAPANVKVCFRCKEGASGTEDEKPTTGKCTTPNCQGVIYVDKASDLKWKKTCSTCYVKNARARK